MFTIQYKYRSSLGVIKVSQAPSRAYFRGITGGVALKYVSQGREEYVVGRQQISVSAGQFIILPQGRPYEAYTGKASLNAETNGICVDLDPNFVLSEIPHLYDQPLLFELPFQGGHFVALCQTFRQYADGAEATQTGLEWMNQLKLELRLLADYIRTLQPNIGTKAKKLDTQKQLLTKLFKAKDYIHQHYASSIRLSELARYAGLSSYYLMRLFQTCFHQSPRELQLELRMNAALLWIQAEQKSLSTIAHELGYSDLAAFSNQFKRYYGATPSQIRKGGDPQNLQDFTNQSG